MTSASSPPATLDPLVAYLADPLDTTVLVLVAGGGRTPDALAKKLKEVKALEHGPTELGDGRRARRRARRRRGSTLEPDAVRAVTAAARAGRGPRRWARRDARRGRSGPTRASGADDVAPYLGEAGSACPSSSSRTRSRRATSRARSTILHRLLHATGPQQPKPMHPLQILGDAAQPATAGSPRLDDPSIRDADAAMAALGGRVKQYPAKKALEQSRALGTDGNPRRVRRAASRPTSTSRVRARSRRTRSWRCWSPELAGAVGRIPERAATAARSRAGSGRERSSRRRASRAPLFGGAGWRRLHQARDPAGRGVLVDPALRARPCRGASGRLTQLLGGVLGAGLGGA